MLQTQLNYRRKMLKHRVNVIVMLPDSSKSQPSFSNLGKKHDLRKHTVGFLERVQTQNIYRFPPEVVAIDTSGKYFDRMCISRKSLHIEGGTGETDTVKRRTRARKPRGKRRNTISGTDQKELRDAIAG